MSTTATSTEPRGIAAAMAQPAFSPRMGQSALGAADRATRRWAPEAPEDQPRSIRSLSFVDRMVSPWVTAAQRSAGLRMFSQYASSDTPERVISGVSWVFPRPWYQDELDWIAASRANQAGQDMIFTTRGTYAQAADRRRESSMPSQLFEYVAPSFSPASADSTPAYSPLVSHSSYSAASVVAQSMQAIAAAGAMARGLPVRQGSSFGEPSSMGSSTGSSSSGAAPLAGFGELSRISSFGSIGSLASSLIPDGESARFSLQPSALALRAPTMVTPPSPRGDDGQSPAAQAAIEAGEQVAFTARSEREAAVARAAAETAARQEQSRGMALAFAQERERVAEQMRVTARAERERAAAAQLEPAAAATAVPAAVSEAAAAEAIRAEAIRQEVARIERARESSARVQSSARQQARIDAIVAERLARLEPSSNVQAAAASPVAQEAAPPVVAGPSEAQSQAMVQALRIAELLAHSAAIGPSAMAPAAGPRMALPSGLGGLVAGMNTSAVIERERAAAAEQSPRRQGALPFTVGFQPIYTAPSSAVSEASSGGVAAPAGEDFVAAPTPVFATPAWAPRALAPESLRADSALGSIASRAPAALGHVAWADRWLGRFAGASDTALEAMSSISMRAQYAPAQLFVAPTLDVPRQVSEAGGRLSSMGSASAPSLEVVAPARRQDAAARVEQAPIAAPRVEAARPPVAAAPEALRFADDDVVPDELFAAIAASSRREPPRAASPVPTASTPSRSAANVTGVTPSAGVVTAQRAAASPQLTAADIVALTAPSAPVDAGLSAALAASPMAPALGHVLSLPRAAVFDPRSLGGAELAFAFLSGTVTAPMVAQYSFGSSASSPMSAAWDQPSLSAAEAPSLWRQWSAELVRPAELTRAAVMREDAEVISSAQRPAIAPGVAASSPVAPIASAPGSAAVQASASAAAEAAASENIITLRSTLLSPASPRQQRLAASAGTVSSWVNQEPVDALPVAYQTLGELLSEAAPDRRWLSSLPAGLSAEGTPNIGGAWAGEGEAPMAVRFDHGFPLVFWPLAASAPGALGAAMSAAASSMPGAEDAGAPRAARSAAASRAPWAPSWAAAPEAEMLAPTATSLVEQGMPGSMDRGALSPGMLAQRALGFGAVQSSQTADLSFDFVPPELVLAARVYGFGPTEAAQAARLAMGGSTGLSAMAGAVDLRFVSLMGPAMGAGGAGGRHDAGASMGEGPSARAPEASAARDPESAFGVAKRMPRGAFLLPSASVAAMGLSAALPEGEHSMSIAALEVLAAKMVAELGSFASPSLLAMAAGAAGSVESGASPARRAPASTLVDITQQPAQEASEEDVLSSASASIAASRRTRFEQLYIALAESNTGRTMSPAARAARALALANRDEDATTLSSRERAALAWQIFPVVLNGEAPQASSDGEAREVREAQAAASRSRSAPALTTVAPAGDRPGAEMRPGLASLSSRAGEALSSFVTSAPSSSSDARPAASSGGGGDNKSWKSGRFGGGEVEIPSWFEAAARKMFEERGEIEGISLAELTLVAATPPAQIAASSRETPASVPQKSESPDAKGEKGQKVDIERVAGEVYRAVMQMMESARMRNGEPYL